MKRALESLLLVAALALVGFVAVRVLTRREPQSPVFTGVSRGAGRDAQDPRSPTGAQPVASIKGMPMVKLSRPPRRRPLRTDIPVPSTRAVP
jgi:hypothetical protein